VRIVKERVEMAHEISKILVGFDGSADAQRALEWGIAEAAERKAALQVVISQGPRLSSYPRAIDEVVAARTAKWVAEAQVSRLTWSKSRTDHRPRCWSTDLTLRLS
jgi:nucleotide-binding universal stress UspA family protein